MRKSDYNAARTAEAPPMPTLCPSTHLSAAALMALAWSSTPAAHEQGCTFQCKTAFALPPWTVNAAEESSGAKPEPIIASLAGAQNWGA